jgi:hypothetical protein
MIRLCKHLKILSEIVTHSTADETDYVNSYKYCEARKMRIPRTGCVNCKLREYEPS